MPVDATIAKHSWADLQCFIGVVLRTLLPGPKADHSAEAENKSLEISSRLNNPDPNRDYCTKEFEQAGNGTLLGTLTSRPSAMIRFGHREH